MTAPTGEGVGVGSRRCIALGVVLGVAGVLALWWSAALGKFRLGTAPSLRCLQPMGWGLIGLVLCLGGLASLVVGFVYKWKRTRWKRAPG